ncbi:hypothetical protein CAPTEDRAFT_167893 [Capitella teleta]|uniref:Disease resistance R13L4/SHOC-2-like LRR domain-containing protein n=1 Tax=Capitella teleta TaxID=283909 RepID=R7UBD2_CAPTE|nr:hypothetical protein CAPTEDRAFT_167893 [Capitella teleta]|eukprot:ELU01108.1 hypothetical protein CAPTEDRAFT_167893 [Capitella teleta]
MGNAIKPHIERAEKTGTCNLSKQGLSEFPGELGGLVRNLRNLDLSENKLPSIPPMIGQFTMMKSLNLESNRLCRIPEDIGNLKKLETLNASRNRLTSLPHSLSQLTHLREVCLCFNALTEFPSQLCGLKQLDMLDLSHNKMTSIPDSVGQVEAIELNLNQNQVRSISESITQCKRLKVLRLEENCLEPSAFTATILQDSSFSLLSIEGNLVSDKQLREMDGYEQYMERFTATRKKCI